MKRIAAFLLALVMTLSLAACGGGGVGTSKLALGETVSTDIIDFSLKDAKFCYYASAVRGAGYCTPIEKTDGGIFTASTGKSFVWLNFSIKNKDRGNLDFGYSHDWPLNCSITYGGKNYPVNGFDYTDKNGRSNGLSFQFMAYSTDGGKTYKDHGAVNNEILDSGESMSFRVLGVVAVDPNNLTDSFDFTIKIPDSSGKNQSFTYSIG